MFDLSQIKNNNDALKKQLENLRKSNSIKGIDLDQYIYNKVVNRIDCIEYCEKILRAHLPGKRQHLHENQTELIRAVCNPKIRKVSAVMA